MRKDCLQRAGSMLYFLEIPCRHTRILKRWVRLVRWLVGVEYCGVAGGVLERAVVVVRTTWPALRYFVLEAEARLLSVSESER
jgi:hypothetical protein